MWSEEFEAETNPIARALYAVAMAIDNLSNQVKNLGNADAATHMGAIEAFSQHIGEKLDSIAEALHGD